VVVPAAGERESIGWCVNEIPASMPMGTIFTASTPLLTTIPELVLFEQASYSEKCFLFITSGTTVNKTDTQIYFLKGL
jgi:hypothetical protein